MKIYQVSGLGANQNAFKYLKIDPKFEVIFLPWLQPEPSENLEHYARRMAERINPNEDFVLMGLSFGGIIVQEMNRFLNPKLTILISTVKDRNELPGYMKLSSKISAHKLIPSSFLASDKGISYSFFRKLYSTKMPDINEFFEYRDPAYLKWSIDQIVNWQCPIELKNYVHFHGDNDIVFPSSHIQNATIIKGGTHIMVMQKSKKLNDLINEKLKEFEH